MASNYNNSNLITCPVCGKKFIRVAGSIYYVRMNNCKDKYWCCGYNCMTKLKKSVSKRKVRSMTGY